MLFTHSNGSISVYPINYSHRWVCWFKELHVLVIMCLIRFINAHISYAYLFQIKLIRFLHKFKFFN